MNAISDRRSMTVRKIGAELNRAVELRRALQENDDPQLLLDTIEGETDLGEACAIVYEETLEDDVLLAGLVAKIEELQTRKSRVERSIDQRRAVILMAMEKAGLGTLKTPLGTMSVRQVPPKAIITDEALIPARFWKPSDPKLDKAALKAALDAKEVVPGATLSNGGIGLTVRVK